MFPLEIWLAYTAACVLLVLSPGPDNLLAVVNQRLVRQVCPFCAQETPFNERELAWLGLPAGSCGKRGQGCERCRNSGFYGRLPVYDIMVVDDALANAIADDASRETLRNKAMNAGFRGIEDIAKARVIAGQTTSEEVMRVAGVGPAP